MPDSGTSDRTTGAAPVLRGRFPLPWRSELPVALPEEVDRTGYQIQVEIRDRNQFRSPACPVCAWAEPRPFRLLLTKHRQLPVCIESVHLCDLLPAVSVSSNTSNNSWGASGPAKSARKRCACDAARRPKLRVQTAPRKRKRIACRELTGVRPSVRIGAWDKLIGKADPHDLLQHDRKSSHFGVP